VLNELEGVVFQFSDPRNLSWRVHAV